MYIRRALEPIVRECNATFRCLYLGGPRQCGKTTLLKHIAEGTGRRYVTLDDSQERARAHDDPALFFQRHPPPVFIDEAQYAPELFPYIKMRVDDVGDRGQYWLTGSQHYPLMRHMQESLAGRVAILTLLGLSHAEMRGVAASGDPFLPGEHWKEQSRIPTINSATVFEVIFRGSSPEMVANPAISRETFYGAQLQTYLDRDIREIFGVEKLGAFRRFLTHCAARMGQLLNFADLARDAGISPHAAREWIDILESTRQIFLLYPWFLNRPKRTIKTPKLYFFDTGLAAYLVGWPDAGTLERSASAGAFFESFAIAEVMKSYYFRGMQPPVCCFRDKDGHEVDLVIEREGGKLYPIEIKMRSYIKSDDVRGIAYLRSKVENVGPGAVLCLTDKPYAIDRMTEALPVSAIL